MAIHAGKGGAGGAGGGLRGEQASGGGVKRSASYPALRPENRTWTGSGICTVRLGVAPETTAVGEPSEQRGQGPPSTRNQKHGDVPCGT